MAKYGIELPEDFYIKDLLAYIVDDMIQAIIDEDSGIMLGYVICDGSKESKSFIKDLTT